MLCELQPRPRRLFILHKQSICTLLVTVALVYRNERAFPFKGVECACDYIQLKRRQMAYSAKKDFKPVNDKAIIPLTLYQINHQLTEDSTFDGQSFYTLSIVGRLENFRRDHNSNMFQFNDGTGKLEGRINLTSGKMPAFAEGTTYQDKYGDYFFVVFKPKFSEGEKKFYIQMIKEIDNYNMITKHFSDVILSSLIRKKNN